MTLTLAVLASMLILLPGLTFLGAWNLKGARTGAGRPELPLGSATTLLLAVGISLIAHFFGWIFVEMARNLLTAIPDVLPPSGMMWSPIEAFLRPTGTFPPIPANPIAAMVQFADGGHLEMHELATFGGLMVLESLLVAKFVSGDGFDLVFDGIDLNGQGWVYHHYIRPTQHGFRPICHVLTTFQQNNLGIGYIGAIADIRHSEKGELLSLALLNPERFLFQLTPSAAAKWCKPSEDPKFDTYGRETIGGIVALDGKSVANLLVRTLDKAILDEIDTAPYGDEESEESAPTTGSAPEAASADPVRPS
ncbi:hypothetical protein ATE67_20400 [Sphingopyxis sp. H050]|uniref:hypothetical protein n=1 Tax=unclassified Sphingopyxis TaxID=2614943 RepID=UPI000736A4B3|nr:MULTISPECIES: hypothetical protein [unclassified Sphingopyxis]KTE04047.1 hypothetical protein ATE71_19290 [Sphingopyxis sp. H115]KTE04945.1 hypothetical protein ATE76_22520 [Sphingopyxis sp. H093]KTE17933.1 hypothetical protein ATE67_20400 [Sphingopyxis sp. H050]KTE60373.1 hypothetical protein ATE74_22340 [Sphingopyxis sp. H085]